MKKTVFALTGLVLLSVAFTAGAAEKTEADDTLDRPPCKFARVPTMKITDSKGREMLLENVLVSFTYESGDVMLPRQAFRCRVGDVQFDLPFDEVDTLYYLSRYDQDYSLFETKLCNGQIRRLLIRRDPITFEGQCPLVDKKFRIDFTDVRRLVVRTVGEVGED